MRVAVVYPIPFGSEGQFGGGERYAWELARALARRVPTKFVTTGPRRSSRLVDDLRVEIYPFLALVHGHRVNPLSISFIEGLLDADVIHCISYNTLITDLSVLFARLMRRRAFITDVGGGSDLSLARRLNIAGRADGLLLLSQFARDTFPEHAAHTRVIYGGVDTDWLRPPDDVGARRRKVICVGRLLAHKGVNYVIDALPQDLRLVVIGRPYSSEYFAYLRELAQGKQVTFITDASDLQLRRAYQSSALAIQASVYRTAYSTETAVPELLGLSSLEAMACATPVVCTSVGSLPELVTNGVTGIVVPPNDPRALRDAMLSILNDEPTGRRMGAAARERVLSSFTWDAVVDRCLAAYSEDVQLSGSIRT